MVDRTRSRSVTPARPRRGGLWLRAAVIGVLCAGLAIVATVVLARTQAGREKSRRVIILGIDALDFRLTQTLLREGRLPNLAALAREGTFQPLQTSMPPLSPVAWTNFATGTNPGGHGIFDFLARDPAAAREGFMPVDGVSHLAAAAADDGRRLPLTPYVLPPVRERRLQRTAAPFWDLLESRGVRTIVYKMPGNFPVAPSRARCLAGMGTPDLEGTYGTFLWITTRPEDWRKTLTGGRLIRAVVEGGIVTAAPPEGEAEMSGAAGKLAPRDASGELPPRNASGEPAPRNRYNASAPGRGLRLHGPVNPFLRRDLPLRDRTSFCPFAFYVDSERRSAAIEIGSRMIVLREGEWSPWVEVRFELVPGLKSVDGLVRFYLQEAGAEARLFVTPVNLPPGAEGLATGGFDRQLLAAVGPYHTKGMSEPTKALAEGVFTTAEYLAQSDQLLGEQVAALRAILARGDFQCLFFYVSTVDLDSHMLWRHRDPSHPAYDPAESPAWADRLARRYEEMDGLVGLVRRQLQPGDTLYVMSDHGFGSFRREVNLLSWLAEEGYLAYQSPVKARRSRIYTGIDWSRTRAYPVGLSGLYVNLAGREAQGTVAPADYDRTVEELRSRLLALRDDDGRAVFAGVYRPGEIYSGPRTGSGPDLVLGYSEGFGPSDESVLGNWAADVVAPHLTGFSGHHEVDFQLVPGVLFCSRKLSAAAPRLEDLTVTVLGEFGVAVPAEMTGRPLN